MNILLTNDDGYNSVGIRLLKEKLSKYGRVVILAPSGPMSAKSASITLFTPLLAKEIEHDVYSLDATPADCVSYALCLLGIKFDLVVSGCNNGLNISYDTMYSGTVGASLEALMFKLPTISVSCFIDHFDVVDKYFDDVFEFIQKNNLLSNEYLLNVNFPKETVKSIELGSLYYRNDQNYYEKTTEGYIPHRYMDDLSSAPKDSDCYQVEHEIVSIVPLSKSYFNNEILKNMKK